MKVLILTLEYKSTIDKKYHNATPKMAAEKIYVDKLYDPCIYVVQWKIGWIYETTE